MIRITLPAAPAILVTEGIKRTAEDCDAYDACPDDYLSGRFVVVRSIYGAGAVKRTLLEAQFNKCCYCERKLRATSPGDVEHYRPKKGVRQDMSTKEEKPGYYWLAYTWINLLVACEKCNRECKRTQFPLANPERRARCHHDRIDEEIPLLVHPVLEDPRMHIRFEKEVPQGVTSAGIATVRVLGLATRPELVDERIRKYKHLALLLQAYRSSATHPEFDVWRKDTRMLFEDEMRPGSEFSSMAIDLLSTAFE